MPRQRSQPRRIAYHGIAHGAYPELRRQLEVNSRLHSIGGIGDQGLGIGALGIEVQGMDTRLPQAFPNPQPQIPNPCPIASALKGALKAIPLGEPVPESRRKGHDDAKKPGNKYQIKRRARRASPVLGGERAREERQATRCALAVVDRQLNGSRAASARTSRDISVLNARWSA